MERSATGSKRLPAGAAIADDGVVGRIENRPLTSLRGVAALWVVFSHVTVAFAAQWTGASWRMLRDGYMGVDVFFVLSGFILGLVYQDLDWNGTPRFFLKRALRLYPLNIAVLLLLAASAWVLPPGGSWAAPRLLPLFAAMLEGYAAQPVPAWNPNTWSVGIELACYLCFPPAIMVLRRLPSAAVAALALGLLVFAWWAQGFCQGWPCGWHALLRGSSGFWPGVLLGVLAPRLPRRCSPLLASVGEAACVAGLVSVVALDALRFVPVITGGLVVLLFFDAGMVSRVLRGRLLFWLGDISFSIYLIFGVLLPRVSGVARWLLARLPDTAAIPVFVLLYLGLTLTLAHVANRLIERPARRLARAGRKLDAAGKSALLDST